MYLVVIPTTQMVHSIISTMYSGNMKPHPYVYNCTCMRLQVNVLVHAIIQVKRLNAKTKGHKTLFTGALLNTQKRPSALCNYDTPLTKTTIEATCMVPYSDAIT